MVSVETMVRLYLSLTSSSRRDTQVRHPRGKGRLYLPSGSQCHVNRSGTTWGTLDCHGRNEEHYAEFPPTSLQQDKHPSTVQVSLSAVLY